MFLKMQTWQFVQLYIILNPSKFKKTQKIQIWNLF